MAARGGGLQWRSQMHWVPRSERPCQRGGVLAASPILSAESPMGDAHHSQSWEGLEIRQPLHRWTRSSRWAFAHADHEQSWASLP